MLNLENDVIGLYQGLGRFISVAPLLLLKEPDDTYDAMVSSLRRMLWEAVNDEEEYTAVFIQAAIDFIVKVKEDNDAYKAEKGNS